LQAIRGYITMRLWHLQGYYVSTVQRPKALGLTDLARYREDARYYAWLFKLEESIATFSGTCQFI